MFLNESKMAVPYILIVFFVLFREELIRPISCFVIGVAAITLIIFGLLTSYVALHAGTECDHGVLPTGNYRQNFSDSEQPAGHTN